MSLSVCEFFPIVVTGDGSNRVGRFDNGNLSLLVPYFEYILISVFVDAV